MAEKTTKNKYLKYRYLYKFDQYDHLFALLVQATHLKFLAIKALQSKQAGETGLWLTDHYKKLEADIRMEFCVLLDRSFAKESEGDDEKID